MVLKRQVYDVLQRVQNAKQRLQSLQLPSRPVTFKDEEETPEDTESRLRRELSAAHAKIRGLDEIIARDLNNAIDTLEYMLEVADQ